MLSTAIAADPLAFTEPEPLSREKIAGLFANLFCKKAETRSHVEDSPDQTEVGEDERRATLTDLAIQWRGQELNMRIDALSATHAPAFVESIRGRVMALREMLREEEGSGVDLSLDSVAAFVAFLRQDPGVPLPNMALTSEGEIYARWKGEGAKLFSLHFISGEQVRFVAFRPNPRRPRLIRRISGTDAVDTVMGFVNNAFSTNNWVLE